MRLFRICASAHRSSHSSFSLSSTPAPARPAGRCLSCLLGIANRLSSPPLLHALTHSHFPLGLRSYVGIQKALKAQPRCSPSGGGYHRGSPRSLLRCRQGRAVDGAVFIHHRFKAHSIGSESCGCFLMGRRSPLRRRAGAIRCGSCAAGAPRGGVTCAIKCLSLFYPGSTTPSGTSLEEDDAHWPTSPNNLGATRVFGEVGQWAHSRRAPRRLRPRRRLRHRRRTGG
jgi:hypothetical protein